MLGGYCKEYSKGKRPIGVMLDDTWFLKSIARLKSLLYPLILLPAYSQNDPRPGSKLQG